MTRCCARSRRATSPLRLDAGMGRGTEADRTPATRRCASGALTFTADTWSPGSLNLSLIGCLLEGLGPPRPVNPPLWIVRHTDVWVKRVAVHVDTGGCPI